MSVARWRGQEGERQVTKFLKDVLERMSEPPWYSTIAQETNQTVSMKRNVNKACVLYIFWHTYYHMWKGNIWCKFVRWYFNTMMLLLRVMMVRIMWWWRRCTRRMTGRLWRRNDGNMLLLFADYFVYCLLCCLSLDHPSFFNLYLIIINWSNSCH